MGPKEGGFCMPVQRGCEECVEDVEFGGGGYMGLTN